MSHRMTDSFLGLKTRRARYRLFLCIGMLLSLLGLGGMAYQQIQGQIPDRLRVEDLDELSLDFGWLITEEVTPEVENVSANAFTQREYEVQCSLLGLIPLKTVSVQLTEHEKVYTGGMPVGIYLETKGILVIGTGVIEGKDGLNYEPARHVVQPGDYILEVNHQSIQDKKELTELISNQPEGALILTLRRKGEIIHVRLETVEAADGSQKAGIWVRDNTQGIGTLTFITPEGQFGALGHGINDVDTGFLLETGEGTLYETNILNIKKGERGNPGELSGVITYQADRVYGSILQNETVGIFGSCNHKLMNETGGQLVETAFKQEVREGKAVIRSAVDGTLTDYEVEITEVRCNERDMNKGIVLEVTDERLLSMTGGIVQGMSGSPILQDGKLIGAVTHVFVQDSAKGFGIFIENMLEQVE
ncbi:MAG: SpoIVB peptidase [Lachnospiraceae bacterium]|nr:SpoIVB peptidase [Lachnospiraceae bacterium]